MNIIKKIYNWLLSSSADPERYSMTIKGLGVFATVGVLSVLNGVTGMHLEQITVINTLANVAEMTSIGLMLFGGTRKLVILAISSYRNFVGNV